MLRFIGGLLYFIGMLIMLWNTLRTIGGGQSVRVAIPGQLQGAAA
jgi:cytochrome c oxidase cbb3-type subunit 1